jgi:hypothetical protein
MMNEITDKKRRQYTAYARMLGAAIGFCAAIFWLVTGEKAPDYNQVLREYS